MQYLLQVARAVLLVGTQVPWELRALAALTTWVLLNLLVAFVAPNGMAILLGSLATNVLALGVAWRRGVLATLGIRACQTGTRDT